MKKEDTLLTNKEYILDLTNNAIESPLNDIKPIMTSLDTINKYNVESPLTEIQKTIKENNLTNQIKVQPTIPTMPTFNIEKLYPGLTNFGTALSKIGKMYISTFTPEKLEALTNPITQIIKKFSDIQQTYLENITKIITNINSNNYFNPLIESIQELRENPNNIFSWMNYYHKLNDYFWIMPYQMTTEQLHDILNTVNTEKEFDRLLIKHFNKQRIENLIDDIKNKLSNKQEVKLFNQIKDTYYSQNYALASIGMLSIIDNCLSYYLINKGSSARINMFKPIIKDLENNDDGTSLIFIVMMIDNNINRLYEQIEFNQKISIKTNKKARRHPSAHGKSYSNKKIDSIMLMNTLYYLLDKKDELSKYKNSLYQENKTFKIATKKEKRIINNQIKKQIEKNNQ